MPAKKIIFISLLTLLPLLLLSAAQDNRWSPFTYTDKREAKTLAINFFRDFNENRFYEIKKMLPAVEMNYSGELWMSTPKFLYFLGVIRERGAVDFDNIRVYTFDDCENEPEGKNYALGMYRVFDSRSILTVTDISFRDEKTKTVTYAGILFRKTTDGKNWYIASISGFDVKEKGATVPRPGKPEDWTAVIIPGLDIEMPIPAQFSEKKSGNELFELKIAGPDRGRASYQIMAVKSRRPLIDDAGWWIKKMLSGKRISLLRAKYLPCGYWFECEMLDRNDRENKIIIVALKKKKYSVFINFFAYMDYYNAIWKKIEYSLRNIVVE